MSRQNPRPLAGSKAAAGYRDLSPRLAHVAARVAIVGPLRPQGPGWWGTGVQFKEPPMADPFSRKHGSLYDRGGADSWYRRPRNPHWYPEGTGRGARRVAINAAEIAEYNAGYDDNEASGDHKNYG